MATYSAISLFIPYHQKLFSSSWYIFSLLGGKMIAALGKITMPITIGYIHNTRTEQVVFDIVDMEYPCNAVIGR
jgi:deoxyxylulose-5-phosphate synthase